MKIITTTLLIAGLLELLYSCYLLTPAVLCFLIAAVYEYFHLITCNACLRQFRGAVRAARVAGTARLNALHHRDCCCINCANADYIAPSQRRTATLQSQSALAPLRTAQRSSLSTDSFSENASSTGPTKGKTCSSKSQSRTIK